jgi:DNA-binding NarL/FixJ family response regulator
MTTRTTTVVETWQKTNSGKPWAAKAVSTATRMYLKGWSTKQIAVMLKRSEKAVYVKLNELGY